MISQKPAIFLWIIICIGVDLSKVLLYNVSQMRHTEVCMLESDLTALTSCYLFIDLPPDEKRNAITSLHISVAEYPAGAVISSPEHFSPALYFVISGELSVTQEHGSNSVLMRLIRPGETFGAASMFGSCESYPTTIRAQSLVRVAAVTENDLCDLFCRHPATAIAHIRFLSDRIRFLNERLDATTGRNVESKLAKYIADTYGKCALQSRLNMTQIARNLDVGRASLYRLISQFVDEGIIDFSHGKIKILNLDLLKRKADIS